jgi:hypothetical protein
MAGVKEAADAWASIYANSPALRSVLMFAHVGGLIGGGGCAIAADRTTLRAFRRGQAAVEHELEHLRHIHRVVIAGLVVVVLSGGLLTFADLESYVASPAFWLKMALVLVLIGNGALVVRGGQRTHAGHADGPRRLRVAAIASLVLWFATTLLGAVLPNAL